MNRTYNGRIDPVSAYNTYNRFWQNSNLRKKRAEKEYLNPIKKRLSVDYYTRSKRCYNIKPKVKDDKNKGEVCGLNNDKEFNKTYSNFYSKDENGVYLRISSSFKPYKHTLTTF